MRLSTPTLLYLAALAAFSCGTEVAEPPPIVLISVDTLRADHLPAYGYGAVETPAIDALAADSLLFERAFSPSPLTLPAHSSMLTGLQPPEHGVRNNLGYRLDAERHPTLSRALGGLGYATAAAVSTFVLRRETGLAAGFDLYEDGIEYRAGAGSAGFQRSGADTLAAILPWLRERSTGPFFLFFHIYEPHTPYQPPEDLAGTFSLAYDGEVAAADRVVGKLLAALRALGRYDESVIVLTSDHGEGLGDHGEDEHGVFLYREVLEVPLLLKLPGGRLAGTRVAAAAQLVDLFPTLIELAGGEAGETAGRSLLGLAEGGSEQRFLYSETFFPRFYFGWSELRSLSDGRYQYIESPEPELFDLDRDPAQRVNLVDREPRRAAELRRRLAQVDQRLSPPEATDAETWRRLAALGYIGHGQSTASGPAPAPRSQVHLLADLKSALRLALEDDHGGAVRALTAILRTNPAMLSAWEQLARSNERLGRSREALAAYERAIELAATSPHLLLSAARTAAAIGELDRARTHAEAAVAWDPAAASSSLSQIALAAGDLALAERQALASLEARTPNVPATLSLARVRMAQGRVREALELADRALSDSEGPTPSLVMLRASLLVRLGRVEEAEAELRAEIERQPNGLRVHSRLALLLARHGRPDEAVAVVRRLVEGNMTPAGFAAGARTLSDLGDPESARALAQAGLERFPQHPVLRELSTDAGSP